MSRRDGQTTHPSTDRSPAECGARRATRPGSMRTRWAAIGAAVAVTLGAGGLTMVSATGGEPSSFVAITPARILDTRAGLGLGGPLTSPTPVALQVTGTVPTPDGATVVVPPGATGVVLNVTAVQPTADGFVSVRPDGSPGAPTTSNLNFAAGDIIPNAVTVALPANGAVELTYDAFGAPGPTTHLLVDVTGYYLAGSGDGTGPRGPVGPSGPQGATGERGPAGPTGATGAIGAAAPSPANVVWVATSGGDFTNVQQAIDSITDASAVNPYLIRIGPGTFHGRVLPTAHVHIEGSGRGVTTLTAPGGPTLAEAHTVRFQNVGEVEIRNLTVVNTGGGAAFGAGIRVSGQSLVRITDVDIAVAGADGTRAIRADGSNAVLTVSRVRATAGATGEGTIAPRGIEVLSSTVRIDSSQIEAPTAIQGSGGTIAVTSSQLAGSLVFTIETTRCLIGNYHGDFQTIADDC